MSARTPFALVHGTWHGAWCWARVRSEPGWRVMELATGHDAMVSAPRELARMLRECAERT